jgi:ubiquinone/menaquinone biosynthesis C-methylase UbiE
VSFETSHTDVEARLLERALQPRTTVLDAGCGRTTRLAAHRPSISRLVGVDLDAAAGAENTALDEFVVADCARLPFDDESFDLVYSNFVIEHLESPQAAFDEWQRVLRPHGSLVLLTSNRANPYLALAKLLPQRARVAAKRLGPGAAEQDVFPAVYRANTPARLSALLEAAGFVLVEVHYVATLHRYAGARRLLPRLLTALERALAPKRRSTIVAWYRAGNGREESTAAR